MKCIGDKCELLEEDGRVIDTETDVRGDFHFNALLDAVADWRKQTVTDCSLGGAETSWWFIQFGLTNVSKALKWLNRLLVLFNFFRKTFGNS